VKAASQLQAQQQATRAQQPITNNQTQTQPTTLRQPR